MEAQDGHSTEYVTMTNPWNSEHSEIDRAVRTDYRTRVLPFWTAMTTLSFVCHMILIPLMVEGANLDVRIAFAVTALLMQFAFCVLVFHWMIYSTVNIVKEYAVFGYPAWILEANEDV